MSKVSQLTYISLFTGIGGLESASARPLLCCELDPACYTVLRRRFGDVPIHSDVRSLHPPKADVVVGGWPCQDISIAGLKRGLAGERSGLFFEMLRVTVEAEAHTLVAENVPNLLSLQRGAVFELLLRTLESSGFKYIAWRTLSAREFGLPHHRERVFIIASKHPEVAMALHRPCEHDDGLVRPRMIKCNGFYWTAGLQSICYSRGFVPTLKVGSGLSIPSPPAIHFENCARKLTPDECLLLQGFTPAEFTGLKAKDIYRMAGNAVALPVGRFVLRSLDAPSAPQPLTTGFAYAAPSGFYRDGLLRAIEHSASRLSVSLHEFVDLGNRAPLSARASAGLVARLRRSGKPCPPDLMELLTKYAGEMLDAARSTKPRLEAGQQGIKDCTERVISPGEEAKVGCRPFEPEQLEAFR